MKKLILPLMFAAMLVTACKPDMAPTQSWMGRWTGPEGTYLMLSRDTKKPDSRYVLSIQSLDYLESYFARPKGDGSYLEFKRKGKDETIVLGNGEATGMKWLLDKKECLIIKEGEGFCRK